MLESQWPEIRELPPGDTFREEWRVRPLHDRRFGDAARGAWLLVGAVAVFLLIACVNVTPNPESISRRGRDGGWS